MQVRRRSRIVAVAAITEGRMAASRVGESFRVGDAEAGDTREDVCDVDWIVGAYAAFVAAKAERDRVRSAASSGDSAACAETAV